eukprot:6399843-Amphidinium_carterae.1
MQAKVQPDDDFTYDSSRSLFSVCSILSSGGQGKAAQATRAKVDHFQQVGQAMLWYALWCAAIQSKVLLDNELVPLEKASRHHYGLRQGWRCWRHTLVVGLDQDILGQCAPTEQESGVRIRSVGAA